MMSNIDRGTRERLRTALLSSDLQLVAGIGDADTPGKGSACTMSEIMLVLTGKLTDGSHPCISEVIRCWVMIIQDQMPNTIRNSTAWREAAVGIAGSASTRSAEDARVSLLHGWAQRALDEIPRGGLDEWLDEHERDDMTRCLKLIVTSHSAGAAARFAAHAVIHGAYATISASIMGATGSYSSADKAVIAYWHRRDLPETLAALVKIGARPSLLTDH